MVLHERQDELAAIDATLREGGLLVLEGVAGIGKTALLRSAADRAQAAERRVLTARGALAERLYGFGVVRQLFDVLLDGDAPDGPAAAAFADVPPDTAPTDFLVLRGLAGLAVAAAEHQPITLLVDDAQWADVASLRFLGFLARRLDGPDVALLVAIRAGEPGVPQDLLADLREAPGARLGRPGPLSGRAIADVVRAAVPQIADDTLARIGTATAGNPLLVDEVVRGLAGGDDPLEAAARDLADGVRRRIERADPAAPVVAQGVAVLGADATLARLAAVLDVPDTDIARAGSALVGAGVLVDAVPYEFVHPLVADAVLAGADAGRQLQLRRAAVRTLRAEGAGAERLATHLVAMPGTGDAEAAAVLHDAAAIAAGRGAMTGAVALLRRALDEPPPADRRPAVLRALAAAERMAGDAASVEHARAALALTSAAEDRVQVSRELARCQFDLSRYSDAARTITAAIREAPDDLAVELRDALRVDLLTVAMLVSSIAVETLLADVARGTPPEDPQVSTLAALLATSMRLTTGEPMAAFMPDLEALLVRCPPSPERLDVQLVLWWGLAMLEEFAVLERLLDAADTTGPVWMRRLFTSNLARATMLQRQGRLDEAIAVHEATLEAIGDNAAGLQAVVSGLAWCLAERGDLDRAVTLAQRLEIPPTDDEGPVTIVHWNRGRVLAAAGRDDEALQAFERGWAIQRTFPEGVGVLWEGGGPERIACLARSGRDAEALADARAVIDASQSRGLTGLQGIGHRLVGELTHDADHLTHATQLLDATALRVERARAHLALGAHLRRAGRRTAAREALGRAMDLAHASGARPLVDRARAELKLAGARPRRDATTGRDALTTAELRVARLAADGASNREIAAELFITTKTVEGHLGRIFRKLDVARRADLTDRLSRDVTV